MSTLKVLRSVNRRLLLKPVEYLSLANTKSISNSTSLSSEQLNPKIYGENKVASLSKASFKQIDEKSLVFDKNPDNFGTLSGDRWVVFNFVYLKLQWLSSFTYYAS